MGKETMPSTDISSEIPPMDYDLILSIEPDSDPVYVAFEHIETPEMAEVFLRSYIGYRVTHAIGLSEDGEGLHPLDTVMHYLSKIATSTTEPLPDETLLEYHIRRGDRLKPWQEAERNLREQRLN